MSEHQHKWSFCRNCLKNVPHYREFRTPLFRVLDLLSLRILRLFRIGPWYCVHCERKTGLLRGERLDAAHFRPPFAESDAESDLTDDVRDPSHAAEPIGNFIKEKESLVMRSSRLKRFTEKYRDSVVRRIMAGTTTMSQARQEKNLSETELLDWIADLFHRMQARLDAHEELLGRARKLEFKNQPPRRNQPDSVPQGRTVEGRVKPK